MKNEFKERQVSFLSQNPRCLHIITPMHSFLACDEIEHGARGYVELSSFFQEVKDEKRYRMIVKDYRLNPKYREITYSSDTLCSYFLPN